MTAAAAALVFPQCRQERAQSRSDRPPGVIRAVYQQQPAENTASIPVRETELWERLLAASRVEVFDSAQDGGVSISVDSRDEIAALGRALVVSVEQRDVRDPPDIRIRVYVPGGRYLDVLLYKAGVVRFREWGHAFVPLTHPRDLSHWLFRHGVAWVPREVELEQTQCRELKARLRLVAERLGENHKECRVASDCINQYPHLQCDLKLSVSSHGCKFPLARRSLTRFKAELGAVLKKECAALTHDCGVSIGHCKAELSVECRRNRCAVVSN